MENEDINAENAQLQMKIDALMLEREKTRDWCIKAEAKISRLSKANEGLNSELANNKSSMNGKLILDGVLAGAFICFLVVYIWRG